LSRIIHKTASIRNTTSTTTTTTTIAPNLVFGDESEKFKDTDENFEGITGESLTNFEKLSTVDPPIVITSPIKDGDEISPFLQIKKYTSLNSKKVSSIRANSKEVGTIQIRPENFQSSENTKNSTMESKLLSSILLVEQRIEKQREEGKHI